MRGKLSISIEEELIRKIEKEVETGLFRNKSHLVEYAVNKFFKRRKNNGEA